MDSNVRRCPICGEPIPHKPGVPAKTCSPACRKERHRRLERERYYHVKDTNDWKETRAAYIARHRQRMANDSEYAELFRAYAREQTRQWKTRIDLDPARREELLESKRQWSAEWREALRGDQEQHEAHKAKMRAWYRSLSPEDRDRIFYAPRRRARAKKGRV